MEFEKMNYFACLLDFYGTMLTKKQFITAKMFFYDNLGITEISEFNKITKQATNDILKRTQSLLETYEKKLQVYKKYIKSIHLLDSKPEMKEQFIKIWEQ